MFLKFISRFFSLAAGDFQIGDYFTSHLRDLHDEHRLVF